MHLSCSLTIIVIFYKKRVRNAHPQPKMHPHWCWKYPLAKKFVFLANVYTVLIKCGKGLSGEQGTPCPPSSYDLFNLYFVFVCIVSEQPSPYVL
jgi:hypothetical protein